LGISVFAIRLQQPGPYAVPGGGNLLSGVLALVLGIWLIGQWLGGSRLGSAINAAVLLAAPAVLFFALYATLAELEEVVVLRAPDREGVVQELRLWVVDHEGVAWVTMPAWKADEHGLDGAQVELVREGRRGCVRPRVLRDRETVDRIFRLRYDRYWVQRLATAVGVFGRSARPGVVTLQLEACPAG
jgi:hypothetical protein